MKNFHICLVNISCVWMVSLDSQSVNYSKLWPIYKSLICIFDEIQTLSTVQIYLHKHSRKKHRIYRHVIKIVAQILCKNWRHHVKRARIKCIFLATLYPRRRRLVVINAPTVCVFYLVSVCLKRARSCPARPFLLRSCAKGARAHAHFKAGALLHYPYSPLCTPLYEQKKSAIVLSALTSPSLHVWPHFAGFTVTRSRLSIYYCVCMTNTWLVL